MFIKFFFYIKQQINKRSSLNKIHIELKDSLKMLKIFNYSFNIVLF